MDTEGFEYYLLSEGLHKTTVQNYTTAVRVVLRNCTEFTELEVKKFLTARLQTQSKSAVNKYVKAIKKFCAFKGLESFKTVKRFKESPQARILLTDAEIEALIDFETNRFEVDKGLYRTFWHILCYTGARPGEICQLTSADIDPSSHVIYIHESKTGKPRTVPILEPLKEVLYGYFKTCSKKYLFSTFQSHNKPMNHFAYMKDWRKRLELLGITKNALPYSLRHSYLTNTLGNGANLYAIQDIVGHTSAETTKRYYHGNLDLMKRAAQKLPMAQKQMNPEVLVEQIIELMKEFLGGDKRFEKDELLEAQKHLYRSIKL